MAISILKTDIYHQSGQLILTGILYCIHSRNTQEGRRQDKNILTSFLSPTEVQVFQETQAQQAPAPHH
jgi:hypothetical protein